MGMHLSHAPFGLGLNCEAVRAVDFSFRAALGAKCLKVRPPCGDPAGLVEGTETRRVAPTKNTSNDAGSIPRVDHCETIYRRWSGIPSFTVRNRSADYSSRDTMKTYVLVVALIAHALPSVAQESVPPRAPNPSLRSVVTPKAVNTVVPIVPQSALDQERIQELTHRVQMLELQTAQRSAKPESDENTAIIAAIIGAAAVFGAALVAALLSILGQLFAAKRAAGLARDEALYRHAEQILELRMKQVQQFYAPIFAFLRQSKDLYDKMLEQLVQDEPARYRKVPKPEGNDFRWEVRDRNGTWQGFRLLDQFPAIKTNPKALALADANLLIGAKICKIISTRAGYASDALVDMLGQYMAHYAILSTIRNGSETEPFEPGWHKVGYFPFGLDTKIGEAYHELNESIDEYGKAYTRTLEILEKSKQ